ncbi:DUF7146 domain-containing protein [Bosea minatitlanensis]|uniref:Toprim domain-containing protein n=1 Tax=Bosea minatitlanensis TaxID=128782 RepID=A0ABW0EZ04_9HYPH|nr:toprim domain-containing protein [Bosea minatitlanensis]MCT4496049.1 toprim domain-containing protein [Bosea minatitlanensis]
MSHPVSIDLIKQKLHERIDTLVPQLFPNARIKGHEWVVGDVFGAPGESLSICRTGKKIGWWKDFNNSGAKGDILTLIAVGMCDGDVRAAIPAALKWLGLGSMTAEELRRQERKARQAREAAEARLASDVEKMRRKAKGYYLAGELWPGTMVERYLLGRAMDLMQLPHVPSAPRFHPRVWNREAGGVELPAMLLPINHAETGQQISVHRTWLQGHPDGRVTKADLVNPKMTLGEFTGGHIPLNRGASGKPLKYAPEGEWVGVAEGVENGWSAAIIRPDWRVVAGVSLDNLANIVLPPQIGGLFMLADNDTKPEPKAGFERAVARLKARGFRLEIVRPPEGIKDFNDWLVALKRQAEQGRVA